MKKVHVTATLAFASAVVALGFIGCHADENDPAGQAKELADPVRRDNAISNIHRMYTSSLSQNNGNRAAPAVKSIADATVELLTSTWLEHEEDVQARRRILDTLYEMRDPRSLPALVKALKWRPEVSEQVAIRAAQTLAVLDIPAGKKPEVVTALSDALEQVSGARGVDNQMRIEFIRALGAMHERSAGQVLTKIMLRQTEDQNFLINRLAGEQLVPVAEASQVDAFVQALYLFASVQPDMRMNDIASEGLVRIGRPAVPALLAVLAGENQQVTTLVQAFIEAQNARLRQRDPSAQVPSVSVASLAASDALYTLGELGFRESIDKMIEMSRSEDTMTRLAASVALPRINRTDADTARVREALLRVYEASDKMSRMQLLRAMQHLNDPGVLPFLLATARAPEEALPDIRVIALNAYAMLANKQEAVAARAIIAEEPEDGFKRTFIDQNEAALAAADECDVNVQCWLGKLAARPAPGVRQTAAQTAAAAIVSRKAAYMIARLAPRGDATALRALIAQIDHPEDTVRNDVFYAIDWLSPSGNAAAIAKINDLRSVEEGRAIWNRVKTIAMMTQARLQNRQGS